LGRSTIGELWRHGAQCGSLGEAGNQDGREALGSELTDGLLALGVAGDFQIGIAAAGIGLVLFGAGVGAFVEGFVELAAAIIDECGVCERGAGQKGAQRDAAGNGLGECRKCY
jgi:hypothetical protein